MKRVLFFVFILVFLAVAFLGQVKADTEISSCYPQCTLNIPRHKIVMDPNNPDRISVIFSQYQNYMYSTDKGQTWSTRVGVKNPGYVATGDHSSFAIDPSGNMYEADRCDSECDKYSQVSFTKINYPGTQTTDFNPTIALNGYTSGNQLTPNVIAQNENNIFVFVRTSSLAAGNIRYFRSTDGGQTFPETGWVADVPYTSTRIGSMLVNGMPTLNLWVSNEGFRYYIWDGNQFVENADSPVLWNAGFGAQRGWTANYDGTTMHFVYNQDGKLMHRYKVYDGGATTTWNEDIVEDLGNGDPEFYLYSPSLGVHGTDLYMVYTRKYATDNYRVFYRKWNSTTETWSSATQISDTQEFFRSPDIPAQIPASADYIPVVWTRIVGTTGDVYFDTIPINSGQEPPIQNDADVNNDGFTNIIDLAIVIFNQGRNSGDANWIQYQHLDVNNDGNNVNWQDVLAVMAGM